MLSLPLPSPPSLQPNRHRRCKISSVRSHDNTTITFESLKRRLTRHANVGDVEKAISTLDLMSRANLTPDLATYSALLRSCIRTRSFETGRVVHSKLAESRLEPDTVVLNSLISLYSKGGDWRKAEEIFSSMGEARDVVSWSAMISCYVNIGLNLKAVRTFIEMVESGEWPNEYSFSAAIQACSNREFARIGLVIFGFLMKTGHFRTDVNTGCAVIELFAKGFGDLELARKVFDEMPVRNFVTWSLMITRFAQMGFPRDAILLFTDMITAGSVPDPFTFSACLSACAELGLSSIGRQFHSWVIKNGFCLNVCVGCCLVDMYAKCKSMDDSRKAFDTMPDHNVISWTALITGYVQNGGHENEAIELYCRMITEGRVLPNHFTLCSLLKACGNLFNPRLGKQIYVHAVKLGLSPVDCVGNSLISMFTKSDRLEDARKAFDLLFEKNLVSYNSLVNGYVRDSDSNEAFELFNQIEKDSSLGADAFTFASLLSGAASVGAIGKGEQMHARLLKSGFESNLSVGNALISMYAKCGNIEAGFQIFNEMENRNIISWTSIITGFAKHGFADRALELFKQMLDFHIQPNEVTYIAVLSACSHAGLIDEGWRHFNSMYIEHGIQPRIEHYACMVDILGRSGFLDQAMQLIDSMPFTANALVWRTLLSACRIHNNAELGKKAAEMIIEQDPHDPSAHVLLSNLYAKTGQWENAAKIRKGMKERNLVKEAGCSWIEIANKMHKFYVADTKHPEAKEIYKELDELAMKIKKMGYVPDTNLVLHEVEEEQKEQYLFQHSEKIALAYGLIKSTKGKPIRIFKNLRVCGDCHNAMKYVSVASGREIIVRDSNRFHHIKDGMCSCKDYW